MRYSRTKCTTGTLVLFVMAHSDLWEFRGQSICTFSCEISASIIDYDDFIFQSQGNKSPHILEDGGADVTLLVVCGHYDGETDWRRSHKTRSLPRPE